MKNKLVGIIFSMLMVLASFSVVLAGNSLNVTYPKVVELGNIGFDSTKMRNLDNVQDCCDCYKIYENHLLDYRTRGYDILNEHGRLIVICYGDFLDEIQPYVNWKRQKGIETDLYDVADIGDTPEDIRDFIESEYFSEDGLTFVQFVGDYNQIPTFLIPRDFCSGDATSDASYSLLDNDNYPDIFVGRFSAETADEVETQVERTMWYERDIVDGDWLHKGTGLGSAWGEGYGYMGLRDRDLVEQLRIMLLEYSYTMVDQLYEWGEPPFGIIPVPVEDFINAINDGRGILIAEGSADCGSSFMIPPGTFDDLFTKDNVYELENQYMLPFVHLGAPYLGNFQIGLTYPEAWLRATDDNGDPIGVIAVYACSTDLDYASPQAAQYETIELLTNEVLNTFGGLMYNGACYSIDLYGERGEKTFKSYNIFGDVSLQVRTDTPESLTVVHDPKVPVGVTSFEVTVVDVGGALCAISRDSILLGSAYTDENGVALIEFDEPISEGDPVDLVVTGYNKITYMVQLSVGENVAPDAPVIDGPGAGVTGEEYTFTFSASDPECNKIFLWIEWGDGEIEKWIGPYNSEEEVALKHAWDTRDKFTIKAKAKDTLDAESDWTEFEFSTPRNRMSRNSLLLRLFEQLIYSFTLHLEILGV
jgi:hypothetical protein